MSVAITGGTGTLGRHVADELRARGHEVRVLSRSAREHPIDLSTGAGLEPALEGCDVVVDASNDSSKRAADVLVAGTRRLLAAGQAQRVRHHVAVSIVGCERVPGRYYAVKAEQEHVVEQAVVPWTLVRATQFHELVAWVLDAAAGKLRVLPVPRARLQTVAAAEVARAIADVVEGAPRRDRIEVAGPEIADARALARAWRAATHSRAPLVPVPLPGQLGRALRAGGLTTEHPDVRGTTPFAAWLVEQR